MQGPINYAFSNLDNYEINYYTPLGRGSIATVYEGRRMSDKTLVAIKKFSSHISEASVIEEVNNCIRIKQYCDADNGRWHGIVKILDIIYDDGCHYVVMERLHLDLFQYIERYKYSEAITAKIIHDIAIALLKMHQELHMIHGDIKLENIAVITSSSEISKNGGLKIKLIDFGSSLYFDPSDSSISQGRVRTGPYGTEMYMSPEIVNGKVFSTASDAWALGVLSLTLMMKRYPFCQQPKTQRQDEIRNINHIPEVLRMPEFKFCDEARAFISHLLSVDTNNRLSLHELLTNNWILQGIKNLSSTPISSPDARNSNTQQFNDSTRNAGLTSQYIPDNMESAPSAYGDNASGSQPTTPTPSIFEYRTECTAYDMHK